MKLTKKIADEVIGNNPAIQAGDSKVEYIGTEQDHFLYWLKTEREYCLIGRTDEFIMKLDWWDASLIGFADFYYVGQGEPFKEYTQEVFTEFYDYFSRRISFIDLKPEDKLIVKKLEQRFAGFDKNLKHFLIYRSLPDIIADFDPDSDGVEIPLTPNAKKLLFEMHKQAAKVHGRVQNIKAGEYVDEDHHMQKWFISSMAGRSYRAPYIVRGLKVMKKMFDDRGIKYRPAHCQEISEKIFNCLDKNNIKYKVIEPKSKLVSDK